MAAVHFYQDPTLLSPHIPVGKLPPSGEWIHIPIDSRTNAAAVKQLLAQFTGIPTDHLSLEIFTGSVSKVHFNPNFESYGDGLRYTPGDEDLIEAALKVKPKERSDNTITTYGSPSISFTVKRCHNQAHCPNMVKVGALAKSLGMYPFDGTTTVRQLSEAIAAKHGIPPEQQRLCYRNKAIKDEGARLQDLGVGHEDGIACVLRLKPVGTETKAEEKS